MSKKITNDKVMNELRPFDSFDEFFLFQITEADKSSFGLSWLDAELEKIDELFQSTYKDYSQC